MADKQVSVELVGKDGLSSVFKRVGDSALASARQIDQAGKSVTTMDRGVARAGETLDRFEASLRRADESQARFSKTGAAVGTTLATVTGFLSDASRIYAEAQVSQERLEASIASTGAAYDDFGQQIDAVNSKGLKLGFDDEDVTDSLSALTQGAGSIQEALNQVGLAEDIARGKGISLAQATKIVVAAEQERYGALARLGIQIDANATKEEALAALQAKFSGQAEKYATTNQAAFERWGNTLENALESVGASTGQLNQMLMILPGLSAGFTTAGAAAGGFFKALGLGSAASNLGPLLGVGALAAGMYAAMEKAWPDDQKLHDAAVGFQKDAQDAQKAILATQAIGDQASADIGQFTLDTLVGADQAALEMEKLSNRINDAQQLIARGGADATLQARLDADTKRYNELLAIYGDSTQAQLDYAKAADALNMILFDQGTGRQLALDDLKELNDQFASGEVDAVEYVKDLITIGTSLTSYDRVANHAAETNQKLADSFKSVLAGIGSSGGDIGRAIAGLGGTAGKGIEQSIGTARAVHAGFVDVNQAMRDGVGAVESYFGPIIADGQRVEEILSTDLPAAFERAQTAATQASSDLEGVFRVAVGNTSAIAQQSQAVQDWADELIGASGTVAKMDSIVGKLNQTTGEALITAEDYTAAQEAYNVIAADNARIQDAILAIQVKQAPVIATAESAMANYWESLAGAGTDAQLFALGMADSTTAMEALSLAQSYLQDQDTFGPMIESASKASPYLAQILEEMGLISYNPATGEVKLLGVDDSQSDLDRLNDTMGRLNNQIAMLVALLDDKASTPLEDIEIKLGILDEMTATPSANLDDNASGPLGTIAGLLTSLDGRSVTAYVNTVSTFSGSSLSPLGYESGGTIPQMASGGTVSAYGYSKAAKNGLTATLVGERGPEVLMLPGGAQVMNTEGSRERWGGEPKIEVHVHVAGSVVGVQDLAEEVSKPIVEAIRQSAARQRQSVGSRR